MNLWLRLPIAFVSGFVAGGGLIFVYFRSRLKFYKRFIEARLANMSIPINLLRPSAVNERIRPVA